MESSEKVKRKPVKVVKSLSTKVKYQFFCLEIYYTLCMIDDDIIAMKADLINQVTCMLNE